MTRCVQIAIPILLLLVVNGWCNTTTTGSAHTKYLPLREKIKMGIRIDESDKEEWLAHADEYDLDMVHSLKDVYQHLKVLAVSPYGHTKLQNLTVKRKRARIHAQTTMGNFIPYMNISIGSYEQKPAIVIVGGIHGSDWLGVAAVMNLIHHFAINYLENYMYLKDLTWIALPVLNPDGYNTTMANNTMRNWFKNMYKPTKKEFPYNSSKNCFGVDLANNFEYQWINYDYENASFCDDHYADKPFSQVESTSLRDTLRDHVESIKMYVIIRQKRNAIMYPYRYTDQKPMFWEIFEEIAGMAAKAAYKQHYRFCMHGHVSKFDDESAGNSDDWVKTHLGVHLCYTYEISNHTDNNIPLKGDDIGWTNDETFAALKIIGMRGVKFDEKRYLPHASYSENYRAKYLTMLILLLFLESFNLIFLVFYL